MRWKMSVARNVICWRRLTGLSILGTLSFTMPVRVHWRNSPDLLVDFPLNAFSVSMSVRFCFYPRDDMLGVERRCACYHRHSEVWSRSWSDTARPTALAGRSRPGSLQAGSDSSPVSVGALHPGLQCWHAPASAFRIGFFSWMLL